jgi:glycosyltransferase involved in cell wall biosynthesis
MIIGMDGTPLSVMTGGIRRYTEELARALSEEDGGDRIHLLSDQPFEIFAGLPNLHFHPGPVRGWLRRRWWSLGLPAELRRRRATVFHGTDFAVPYFPSVPAVMTLHDLSPWLDPAWHSRGTVVRKRTLALLRLGSATMIITPTEAIRREAIERFRLHPSRVAAVPEAASAVFRPGVSARPEPAYILYAGTLEPRKNLAVAVEAWRAARARTPLRLVLAGRQRRDWGAMPSEFGIEYTGPVSDEQLARLYANACAVVYPSLYEGFGLPMLEAMQSGAVVIASRDPALAEVSGGAAIHIDARDVHAWADAIVAVASDPSKSCAMRERGLRRAAEFSWRHTARRTREVYQEAIGRFHG